MPVGPCKPEIVQCRGGFAATTPRGHPYRIGVVAPSAEEAQDCFDRALSAWEALRKRAADEERPGDGADPVGPLYVGAGHPVSPGAPALALVR